MLAGHLGDAEAAAESLTDPEPVVRAAGLGALARCGKLDSAVLVSALGDAAPEVRRRACELAATLPSGPRSGGRVANDLDPAIAGGLVRALGDPEPLVVEAACWALGERRPEGAIVRLAATAADHPDPRCREAAVAALGAIGDPTGLPAVLAALADRPAVRRRATVALAAFEGPAVLAALQRSARDRDWQVREVADILLDEPD